MHFVTTAQSSKARPRGTGSNSIETVGAPATAALPDAKVTAPVAVCVLVELAVLGAGAAAAAPALEVAIVPVEVCTLAGLVAFLGGAAAGAPALGVDVDPAEAGAPPVFGAEAVFGGICHNP